MRLKSLNTFPPGAFPYTQTEGVHRVFEAGGYSIEQQAARVSEFRRANNLPRPDIHSCADDIEQFTVARLNYDPAYCYEPDGPVPANKLITPSGGCAGCGANVS